MKTISIIGSTGSIGLKALEIVRTHPQEFRIASLAVRRNFTALFEQAKEFRPELVCIFDAEYAAKARPLMMKLGIPVVNGEDGLETAATLRSIDQVLFSLVGAVGLRPLLAAIRAGKDVAIANKEPLVMAGELLMREAEKNKINLLPVDSEHSGLWQCLEGRAVETVKKLVLTSSGGPFRSRKGSLSKVTIKEALRHPRWKMGPKITIDSATLMNKGLEVIEAANLFKLSVDRIEVLIHPEALVHALVEFIDGSHLAQLAATDMRIPIQYALSFPERLNHIEGSLDLVKSGPLNFQKPDHRKFPCLELGYEAKRKGGTMPAVLNAANETAVEAFLTGKISFSAIPKIIEKVVSQHRLKSSPGLADILEADGWAREAAGRLIQ